MAMTPLNIGEILQTGTVTVPSNVFSNSTYILKKKNGLVTFSFSGSVQGSIAGYDGLICTLPTGFRPSATQNIYMFAQYSTQTSLNFFNLNLNTDGTVKTHTGGGTFSGDITIQATFFI